MQLPLAIQLNEYARFENFVDRSDAFLTTALSAFVSSESETVFYIWGASSVGKTHLLQAACQQAGEQGVTGNYLPMSELVSHSPALLQGMETMALICVDDIQAIVDKPDWQEAFFNLFNQMHDYGGKLVFAAIASPREMGLSLNDLVSRLEWGQVFHLTSADDEQKKKILQLRSKQKGLQLDEDVARYLLNHFSRNLADLIEILDTLDQESLIRKRRITIPLIREVFADLNQLSIEGNQ